MKVKVINEFVAENIMEVEEIGMVYLQNWNGERWFDCFRCDKHGYPLNEDTKNDSYTITPVYNEDGEDYILVDLIN